MKPSAFHATAAPEHGGNRARLGFHANIPCATGSNHTHLGRPALQVVIATAEILAQRLAVEAAGASGDGAAAIACAAGTTCGELAADTRVLAFAPARGSSCDLGYVRADRSRRLPIRQEVKVLILVQDVDKQGHGVVGRVFGAAHGESGGIVVAAIDHAVDGFNQPHSSPKEADGSDGISDDRIGNSGLYESLVKNTAEPLGCDSGIGQLGKGHHERAELDEALAEGGTALG